MRNIVGLTKDDLRAGWEYCNSHQAEIEHDIQENEAD